MSLEDGLIFVGALLLGAGLLFIDWRIVPILYGSILIGLGARRLI